MDTSTIASLASALSASATGDAVRVSVQRKALDIQMQSAQALIQVIEASPKAPLPPHLGRNIDTTA